MVKLYIVVFLPCVCSVYIIIAQTGEKVQTGEDACPGETPTYENPFSVYQFYVIYDRIIIIRTGRRKGSSPARQHEVGTRTGEGKIMKELYRTEISGGNMDFLMGEEHTPRQMVEFLNSGAVFRGFDDVIKRLYPGEDLGERLTAGMERLTGESHESTARKVRNWLNGRSVPRGRETLFQMCFALGLDEARASRLLGAADGMGIHYRDPEELVYAYALRTGRSYEEAQKLKKDAEEICRERPAERREEEPAYTRRIQEAFLRVRTDGELMDFFRENGGNLGKLHETAYRKFAELLEILRRPEGERDKAGPAGEEERAYTMEEIVFHYLGMNVPEGRKLEEMTPLQKLVKKYWPNESSLVNMKNRKEDVSRKVMILLYLIIESYNEEDWEEDLEEEPEDGDTRLEIRLEKLNLFLDAYGMSLLDPGNAFDLLVLYAMRAEEMGEQMELVLDELYMGRGRRKKVEK